MTVVEGSLEFPFCNTRPQFLKMSLILFVATAVALAEPISFPGACPIIKKITTLSSIDPLVQHYFSAVRAIFDTEFEKNLFSFGDSTLIVDPAVLFMEYSRYKEFSAASPLGIDVMPRGPKETIDHIDMIHLEPHNMEILNHLLSKGMNIIFLAHNEANREFLKKMFLPDFRSLSLLYPSNTYPKGPYITNELVPFIFSPHSPTHKIFLLDDNPKDLNSFVSEDAIRLKDIIRLQYLTFTD
ncbi:MAG: hypothetical protein Hyperionvirus11_18 [Hyperionvirus sp.]|uniref:Uncharacterized protein n=1 Tax=Hyperionvirus sp. TaxID=2487770 RepID=A0A3G5A934_9VIRU|nr:MAG: hypothetical protein Hyperionvirus11_18 [Hyperionvirus sp.]